MLSKLANENIYTDGYNKKRLGYLKTGVIIGLVLGWIISGSGFSSLINTEANNTVFCFSVLAGLFIFIVMQAFHKLRYYLQNIPAHYVRTLVLILLFIKLFYHNHIYFEISAFLLGLCTVYLIYSMSDLFLVSEEPEYLVGISLLTAYMIYTIADIYLFYFPEHFHLTSFVLGFSVILLFQIIKHVSKNSVVSAHNDVEADHTLYFTLKPLNTIFLFVLCFFMIFLMNSRSTIILNDLYLKMNSIWLYIMAYILYYLSILLFTLLIKRVKLPYILVYCLSILGCAVTIELAVSNNIVISYISIFFFILCVAGVDVLIILILVFLSKQTANKIYIFSGWILYGLSIEFSGFFGSLLNDNPFFNNNYLQAFIIIYVLLALLLISINRTNTLAPVHKSPNEPIVQTPISYDEEINVFNLTNAERKVFLLICRGFSNEEIVNNLKISLSTVKFHSRNIMHKVGVKNRRELLALLLNSSFSDKNKL